MKYWKERNKILKEQDQNHILAVYLPKLEAIHFFIYCPMLNDIVPYLSLKVRVWRSQKHCRVHVKNQKFKSYYATFKQWEKMLYFDILFFAKCWKILKNSPGKKWPPCLVLYWSQKIVGGGGLCIFESLAKKAIKVKMEMSFGWYDLELQIISVKVLLGRNYITPAELLS